MSLRHYVEALLGLLYPAERFCISCHGPLPEAGQRMEESRHGALDASGMAVDSRHVSNNWLNEHPLCGRCQFELKQIEPPHCFLCGRHLAEPGRCPECERETSFMLSRSYGAYQGVLRDMLHRFKFSREEELLSILGPCLCNAWDQHLAHFPIDVLVPVPVSDKRLQERGYNQAERLAVVLSSYSKIPWQPLLQRNLHLKGQATRSRRERLRALLGTYSVTPQYRNEISGKRILLVDDIYTTGSTAEACSLVLKEAGALQVYVITVAR